MFVYKKKGDIMIYIGIYYAIVVIVIVILSIKNKINSGMLVLIMIMFPLYLPFIVGPIWVLNSTYHNNSGVLVLILAFLAGYIVIRLGMNIYNKIKVNLSKEEGIYIRDMEVEYSPAVLSYLQNQKIEEKKDLVACILNLCARGFLQIEKKGENQYELIPLKDKNSKELKKDENYLYETICKKEKIDVNKWIKFVKEEFESYDFIKESGVNLTVIFLFSYFAIMIGTAIYQSITGNNLDSELFTNLIMTIFMTTFELAVLEPIIRVIIEYLRKGEYLDGTYSVKGAREMKRWDKYKKFLQDYTLLKDKPLESVTILEKHIAYATVLNINKSYTESFIEQLKVTHKINLENIENIL